MAERDAIGVPMTVGPAPPSSPVRGLTLDALVRQHARSRPDALAAAGEHTTAGWSQLAERVEQVSGALAAAGVGPGDRVVWLGQGSDRVLELLLGCARRRAILCPGNWRLAPPEVAFLVDDLEPVLVFTQRREVGDRIHAGVAAARHRPRVLVHDDDTGARLDAYEDWVAGAGRGGDEERPEPDDPVVAFATAAVDGRPAAACLSHRALIAQALLMGPWMGVGPEHRFLAAGPLFHVGVWMEAWATFVAGGATVFARRNDGAALCRLIERHRCTGGYLFGPMVEGIVEANADGRFDLSSLRGRRGHPVFDAWVGEDPSPWGRRPGGYGQTELTGMATFNLLAAPGEQGSHGRPSPLLEVRVVDPEGGEAPVGDTGEIVARGLTVTEGYWRRPERNAARTAGGWWHTGDLGRYERDGTFSFVGPRTRMLKTGAENVYPAEVEAVLRAHPAVADAVVFGVPDDRFVQRVVALVEPRAGTEPPSVAELLGHCRERLAGYKCPREVTVVSGLPRAADGRVDRDEVDRRHGGGGYPGGQVRSV